MAREREREEEGDTEEVQEREECEEEEGNGIKGEEMTGQFLIFNNNCIFNV
jgi:hypothetical protein